MRRVFLLAFVCLSLSALAQEDPLDLENHSGRDIIVHYYGELMQPLTDTLRAGESQAFEIGDPQPILLGNTRYMLMPGETWEIHPSKDGLLLKGGNKSRLNDLVIWQKMQVAVGVDPLASPASALTWLQGTRLPMSPSMRALSVEYLESFIQLDKNVPLSVLGSEDMPGPGRKLLLRQAFDKGQHDDLRKDLDMIAALFKGESRDFLFVVAANYYASHPDIHSGLEYMAAKLNVNNRQYFNHYILNDYYPNTVFRFAHGEQVSKFGDSSVMSLPRLTDLYQGKPVYIDLWASWCLPCRKEMPAWYELKKEFGDKIAFVSLSIDQSRYSWERMVPSFDTVGRDHYLIQKSEEVARILKLSSIPRYLLLTSEHNILTSTAPRPSDPAARAMLKRLSGD